MPEFLVGVCQVQLKKLRFVASRDKIDAATKQLVEVFTTTECEPYEHQNQYPVVVSPREFEAALAVSRLSMQDLVAVQEASSRRPIPKLHPSGKLRCLHGRQRYEAALLVHGPEMWWAVRVFLVPEDCDIPRLLRGEIEQYFYQTPPSDGEIFLKVRYYTEVGMSCFADEWRTRLSGPKKISLRAIETHPSLLEKLDQLRTFPGLWVGLQLGNIQKHLAAHAVEEMLRYLQHVYNVWDRITLHNDTVRQATDITTVRYLELRAPGAIRADADALRQLMSSGELFQLVSDPALRSRLQHEVLSTRVLIPSIRTFHENMRYLSIGMQIIKDHVIDELGGRSMYRAMRECWRPAGPCLVEYGDDDFRELHDLPQKFSLAYCQVFIAALRSFPQLSNWTPRCEKGQKVQAAAVNDARLRYFLQGARRQGFLSNRVTTASIPLSTPTPTRFAEPHPAGLFVEVSLRRRCGRPYMGSFSSLTSTLFLPNLVMTDEESEHPSALFIQADFIRSFFGDEPFSMHSLETVRGLGAANPRAVSNSPITRMSLGPSANMPLRPTSDNDRPTAPAEPVAPRSSQGCPVEPSASITTRMDGIWEDERHFEGPNQSGESSSYRQRGNVGSVDGLRDRRRAGWIKALRWSNGRAFMSGYEGLSQAQHARTQSTIRSPENRHYSPSQSLPTGARSWLSRHDSHSTRSLYGPVDVIAEARTERDPWLGSTPASPRTSRSLLSQTMPSELYRQRDGPAFVDDLDSEGGVASTGFGSQAHSSLATMGSSRSIFSPRDLVG